MAMTDDEMSRLADAWLKFWHADRGSATRERLRWAFDREREMVYEEPEELWRFILDLHRKDHSPAIQEVLSAGPLQALLVEHGQAFIDRIQREAIADPSFAELLGGVWGTWMSDDVWARVQSVWDRRGWGDHIPE